MVNEYGENVPKFQEGQEVYYNGQMTWVKFVSVSPFRGHNILYTLITKYHGHCVGRHWMAYAVRESEIQEYSNQSSTNGAT